MIVTFTPLVVRGPPCVMRCLYLERFSTKKHHGWLNLLCKGSSNSTFQSKNCSFHQNPVKKLSHRVASIRFFMEVGFLLQNSVSFGILSDRLLAPRLVAVVPNGRESYGKSFIASELQLLSNWKERSKCSIINETFFVFFPSRSKLEFSDKFLQPLHIGPFIWILSSSNVGIFCEVFYSS